MQTVKYIDEYIKKHGEGKFIVMEYPEIDFKIYFDRQVNNKNMIDEYCKNGEYAEASQMQAACDRFHLTMTIHSFNLTKNGDGKIAPDVKNPLNLGLEDAAMPDDLQQIHLGLIHEHYMLLTPVPHASAHEQEPAPGPLASAFQNQREAGAGLSGRLSAAQKHKEPAEEKKNDPSRNMQAAAPARNGSLSITLPSGQSSTDSDRPSRSRTTSPRQSSAEADNSEEQPPQGWTCDKLVAPLYVDVCAFQNPADSKFCQECYMFRI